ncbi:hypothetical protein J1605_016059 [Eschrichtius robustus]|uniref:Uncharacterized protein n=1 Tax=Eschrichtius robustus TaxID=9764 RepID=A0AB34G7K9_ESCRO|nr:hypothetical protein J1605_016059 [Eschrichtius robustus]
MPDSRSRDPIAPKSSRRTIPATSTPAPSLLFGPPGTSGPSPFPLLYTRSHRLRLLQGNKDVSSLRFPHGTGTAQTTLNQAAEKSKKSCTGFCPKSFRVRVKSSHGAT